MLRTINRDAMWMMTGEGGGEAKGRSIETPRELYGRDVGNGGNLGGRRKTRTGRQ